MNTMRTAVINRTLPLAMLPLTLAVAPAVAQSDTVIVQTVSTWQRDVDRMRQELVSQRRLELEFVKSLNTLRQKVSSVPLSERAKVDVEGQVLFRKLIEVQGVLVRLGRDLEKLCATVRLPEGYIGVATTGVSMIDRQHDGTKIVRFLERPTVESVDPGSPADRVGLKSGDVLIEIAGKTLLHNSVVFAELLRPGERVPVKLLRGREIIILTPVVEPSPQSPSETPCARVDAGTAYVVSPMPAVQGFQYEYRSGDQGSRPQMRSRVDSSALVPMPIPTGTVFPAAMARFYGGNGSALAGMEFFVLGEESSRAFGVAHGLLVNMIAPGTPGREAGLQGGDILVSADSIQLRSVRSLQRALTISGNNSVTIVLVRKGKQESVVLRWVER